MRRARIRWLIVLMLGLSGPAVAQTAENPPILIVDMQRIKNETAAGRDIQSKKVEIRARIQKAIADREAAIRLEEQILAEERPTLTGEEFRTRVQAFEKQVFENRAFAEVESRRLQQLLQEASALLRGQVTRVLATIMRERNALVLLDPSQIVLSVDQLNITDEAIARLDKVLPEVELSLDIQGAD